MELNKNKIIIILFTILFLLSIIWNVFQYFIIDKSNVTIEKFKQEKIIEKKQLSFIVDNKNYKKPDFMSCVKESSENCNDKISFAKSNTDNDIYSCDNILNSKQKENCINTFYYNKAIKEKSNKTCEKIEDENIKNNCLDYFKLNLAKNTDKNFNWKIIICNSIKNTLNKLNCKKNIINSELIALNEEIKKWYYVDKITKKEIILDKDIDKISFRYLIIDKKTILELKPDIQKLKDFKLEKINEEFWLLENPNKVLNINEKKEYEDEINLINITYEKNEKNSFEKEIISKEINYNKLIQKFDKYNLNLCNKLSIKDRNTCKDEFLYFNKRNDSDCKLINNEQIKNNCLKKKTNK